LAGLLIGCGLLGASEVSLRYIDIAHPSVTQRVEASTEGVQNAKYVRVDVVQITNPHQLALSFDVFFKADGGPRVSLGSFGPYPADNPGQFIVPTKGLVRPAGSILVSLVVPDHASDAEGASIRVGIGPISLVP